MFLCEPCHKRSKCERSFIEMFGMSHGPCESCNTVTTCFDCHGY